MASSNSYIGNEVIYRRSDDRALVPLITPVTQLGANSAGNVTGIPIGFTFNFDAVAFTTLDLFAFGFARLAGAESSATNANLFAANTSVLLAPWWDNLETADTVGYLKTELQGSAPWRKFVVEWYCNAQGGQTATDYDRLKFQLVLLETLDRFEFRYTEAIETAGAPARGAYSASIGAKGDTSVTATNRRDFWVQDADFGGSFTATTSNLSAFTQWPTWTVLCEPAWPQCGRLYTLDQDEIHGLQDPYGEPIWKIANAINWLWCNHCPPLLNISPVQQSAAASVQYVVPVFPSNESLDYVCYVQTYSTAGGDLRIEIDRDNGASLQPADAGWLIVATQDALGTPAGWHEWPSFQFDFGFAAYFSAATTLKVRASHLGAGTVIMASMLIVPKAYASVLEWFGKSSFGDFLPMSIAQLRQQGAAVHPEFYNRAWTDIAYILRDRRQMAWSCLWPSTLTTAATTQRPRRMIGISPAYLPSPGQQVTVRSYAAISAGTAEMQISEAGGAAKTWSIGSSLYQLDELELDLVSTEPVITLAANPVTGNLQPMAVVVEWAPELGTDDLILGVTPAPKIEYLVGLANRINIALRAYCMTGLATLLARGKTSGNAWRVQYQIPPGVKALRPKIARITADTTVATSESTIYGVSSGSAVEDQLIIPTPQGRGIDDIPPEGMLAIASGAQVYETSPTAAMDRLLESPTALTLTQAVRERLDVLRGVGITLVPIRANPGTL